MCMFVRVSISKYSFEFNVSIDWYRICVFANIDRKFALCEASGEILFNINNLFDLSKLFHKYTYM